MAASGSGRISFSSFASQPRGATTGATSGRRNPDFLKFCNGEFMGGKKLTRLEHHRQRRHRRNNHDNNDAIFRINGKITSITSEVESQLKELDHESKNPKTVLAVILGGGAGTRLFPLTKRRAKPAVPIGGAYRLIDVPVSNCINSGINKIYILTQYNSCSLNRHIARSYSPGGVLTFGDGYVEVLAATQVPGQEGQSWFQGTADAVRQFHWLFEDQRAKKIEDVLILSGDHLYRMNYMDLIQVHRESEADITLSCLPIDESEKPKGEDLKAMEVDTTLLGLSREEAEKKPYIASMGVYVFKKQILLNLLRWRFPTANDFGSEIIPACASEFYMKAFLFNDYWEDIGTLRSFFEANLALTEHPPRFSFYETGKPMYTSRRNLPPSNIDNSKIVDSIVSHGCFLNNSFIEHSVVGIRSRINSNVHLRDTVMLGADHYETEVEVAKLLAEGKVPIGIGENTKIKDCIIDKNARIGKNVIIANSEGVQEADRSSKGFYIRSGITIVLKNSVIEDGFII
ncbi:Clathrin assembly protein complex 2 beta large chain [Stylosanthes scabra]|uniref:glucose-1-phosphate adenylyltransferase n=1 Tax=Stylosanthes scabra TaxID=79078 RepID=A0ABU6T5B1_9FABA|nr:Clathrin assembly protein complex 2 beta large chain [Stylosanthes scabra]